jgi:hypothetical protein
VFATIPLGIVALILIAVIYLNSSDFQRRAQGLLVAEIEKITGEKFDVVEAEISLLPPRAALHGARLTRKDGRRIATVDQVQAPLVWRGGKFQLGQIRIEHPRIELTVDKQGKLDAFRNLNLGKGGPKGAPLTELPWRSLTITDADIQVRYPDGVVALQSLNVVPINGPLTEVTGDLRIKYKELDETSTLVLEPVTLGPNRIDVPSLHVQFTPVMLDVSFAHDLGGAWTGTLTGHTDLEQFNVVIPQPRGVHGVVDLDLTLSGTPNDPVVQANVLGKQVSLEVKGALTPILHYDIGDISAAAQITKKEVVIQRVISWFGDGNLNAHGTISLPDLQLDATVKAESLSLEHLLKSFDAAPTPWIDMNTDLEVQLKGPLKPVKLTGDFEMAVSTLQVGDRPISAPDVSLLLDIPHAYAMGTMLVDKDHVYLAAPIVHAPTSTGELTVDIGTKPRGPLDLNFILDNAQLKDFRPLGSANLDGYGYVKGRIHGPFNKMRFDGWGDIRDFDCIDIPWADRLVANIVSPDLKTLLFDDAVAELGRSRYEGDFLIDFRSPISIDTSVTLTRGRVEDITGMFLDLPGLQGDMRGYLALKGPVYDLDGAAHLRLSDADLWGERFETGEAHGYMDEGLFTMDDLRLSRHDGTAGLSMRGSIKRDYALNMELVGDGFRLERMDWLADWNLPVTGRARFLARIDNTLFDPAPHGRIVVDEVRYAGQPVDDSLVLFETRDAFMHYGAALLGGAFAVDGTLGLWNDQPYQLHADFDQFPLHLAYPTAADGQDIEAVAAGNMDVSGHFGEEWSPVDLVARVDEALIAWDRHEIRNLRPWSYEQAGTSFAITDFNVADGSTNFRLDGSGDAVNLELAGEGAIDLDLLRALVPGMERAEGEALLMVTASGAAPDVHSVVEVELDGALMRHGSVPAAFEEVKGRATVTRTGIELSHAEAGLGGGMVHGSGSISSVDWVPDRWDLSAEIFDAQIQWVDYLPPATGGAALTFDGPADQLLLQGDVRIDEMVFSDRIDWEDWVVAFRDELLVAPAITDDEAMFSFDIHMAGDHSIRLQNNVAEGTASADLRLIGDTVRPGLVGAVRTHDADAYFQDRRFRMERGNLTFNDPWTWDPDLDFSLVTDINSRDRPYRITLGVVGPFSDWRTTTRSDPSLPQSDVNALLWFGVTTEDLEDSGELLSAVVQGIGDLVLTDIFLSTQASELGDEVRTLFFDRMELATGLNARGEYSPDPRLQLSKRYTDLGDVELTAELNLSRPGDQYYRLDKRLSSMWTLSGWYATLARDRGLVPMGGAFGVDVSARWESE